jgi:thioredoxin 1
MGKYSDLINKDKLVLIDFTASWCGPCKAMAPILESTKKEIGNSVDIVKIDVDKNPGIAQNLNIQGVPTLILYKKGKQLWRKSGVIDKHTLLSLFQQFA